MPPEQINPEIVGNMLVQNSFVLRPIGFEQQAQGLLYILVGQVARSPPFFGQNKLEPGNNFPKFRKNPIILSLFYGIGSPEVAGSFLTGLVRTSNSQVLAGFGTINLQDSLFAAALGADHRALGWTIPLSFPLIAQRTSHCSASR